MGEIEVAQIVVGREVLSDRSPQMCSRAATLLLSDYLGRTRDGAIQRREEGAQVRKRFANGIPSPSGIGVCRVDGIGQRSGMAIGTKSLGRNAQ